MYPLFSKNNLKIFLWNLHNDVNKRLHKHNLWTTVAQQMTNREDIYNLLRLIYISTSMTPHEFQTKIHQYKYMATTCTQSTNLKLSSLHRK